MNTSNQIFALWLAIIAVFAWGEIRAHQRMEPPVQIHRYEFASDELQPSFERIERTGSVGKRADPKAAESYYDGRRAPAGAVMDGRLPR